MTNTVSFADQKAAQLKVKVSSFDVDFYVCMRKQCHWHGLSEKDCRMIIPWMIVLNGEKLNIKGVKDAMSE